MPLGPKNKILHGLQYGPQGYEPVGGWPLQPAPLPGQTIFVPPSNRPDCSVQHGRFMQMGMQNPMQGHYLSYPSGMPTGQIDIAPSHYLPPGMAVPDIRGRSLYRGMPVPRSDSSSSASTASSVLTTSSLPIEGKKKGKKTRSRSHRRSRSRSSKVDKGKSTATKTSRAKQGEPGSDDGGKSKRSGRDKPPSPTHCHTKDDGWTSSSDSAAAEDMHNHASRKHIQPKASKLPCKELLNDILDNHTAYVPPTKPLVSAMKKHPPTFTTSPEHYDDNVERSPEIWSEPKTPRIPILHTFSPPTPMSKDKQRAKSSKYRRRYFDEVHQGSSRERIGVQDPLTFNKQSGLPQTPSTHVNTPKTQRIDMSQSPSTFTLKSNSPATSADCEQARSSVLARQEFEELRSGLVRQANRSHSSFSEDTRAPTVPSSPVLRPSCPAPTGDGKRRHTPAEDDRLAHLDTCPPSMSRRSTHTGVVSPSPDTKNAARHARRPSIISDKAIPGVTTALSASSGRDAGLDHVPRIPVSVLTAKPAIITLIKPEHMSQEEWEAQDEEPESAPYSRMPDSVVQVIFIGTSLYLSEAVLMRDSPNMLSEIWQRERHNIKPGRLLKIPIQNHRPTLFSVLYDHMAGEDVVPLSMPLVRILRNPDVSQGKDPYEVLYEEALFYGLTGLQDSIYDYVVKPHSFSRRSRRSSSASSSSHTPQDPLARREGAISPSYSSKPGPRNPMTRSSDAEHLAVGHRSERQIADVIHAQDDENQSLTALEKEILQSYLSAQKNVQGWLSGQAQYPSVSDLESTPSFTEGWHIGTMTAYKFFGEADHILQIYYQGSPTGPEDVINYYPSLYYGGYEMNNGSTSVREDVESVFQAARSDTDHAGLATCLGAVERYQHRAPGIQVAFKFEWCLVLRKPREIITHLYVLGWWRRGRMHFSSHSRAEKQLAKHQWKWTLDAPMDQDSWTEKEVRVAFRPSAPSLHVFRSPKTVGQA